ncbi:MAG TPA: hypothetical protein DCE44_15425 [Verrucomicrobiales bacterium]|nr:hypothetical protein [Verrucomicrobiales bacterium]
MRRVAYSQIFEQACQLAFGQRTANTEDAATLQVFLDNRLNEFWSDFFWPDVSAVEERWFRPWWVDGDTYLEGTEVYHAPSDAYYRCLDETSIEPATFVDGQWVVETTDWAVCQAEYSGEEWAEGMAYEDGDWLISPLDNKVYQVLVDHTSGSSWNAAVVGLLVSFVRSIDWEQTGMTAIDAVEKITPADPRIFSDQQSIDFALFDNIVVWTDLKSVWVKFRSRPGTWSGSVFVANTTYAAGDQVYYSGDWYVALDSTTATPDDATHWERIPVPYIFRDCAPMAAYADWLTAEGQHEKAAAMQKMAMSSLEREKTKILLDQSQSKHKPVRSYR